MNAPDERLTPLAVAARQLGVPIAWLKEEVEAGRLPALRAGARALVDLATIERALLARAKEERASSAASKEAV